MNAQQVESILHELGTEVHHDPPGWSLYVSGIYVLCILDEATDRVRLMAPVSEAEGMSSELLSICLQANFDRTLDSTILPLRRNGMGGVSPSLEQP